MKQFHARRYRPLIMLVVAALMVGLFAFPAVAYGDSEGHGHGNGNHGDNEDRGHGKGHGSVVFTDVPSDHWAWGYVSIMGAKGILAGYGNGKFGPQNHVSRLELVIMITRLLGAEEEALALDPDDVESALAGAFKDWRHIPTWSGARECLAYALKAGYLWPLLQGSSHNFQPGTPATRVEVVATLLEAMGLGDQARDLAGSALGFHDAEAVPAWARGYVALAVELGILTGDGGNLRPNQPVTRSEMAALLARADEDIDTDLDRGVVSGTVTAIHLATSASDTSTITIRRGVFGGIGSGTTSGQTQTYQLTVNVVVMIHDALGRLSDIAVGSRVALYLDEDGQVLLIDAEDEQNPAPTTVAGTLISWSVNSAGKLTSLTIRPITTGSHSPTPVTYSVAPDATITRNGHTVSVSELQVGFSLRLGLLGGVVKTLEIIGEGDHEGDLVTGVITRVTVGHGTTVASSVSIIPTGGTAGDEHTYVLAHDAVVVVNDTVGDLGDAQPGDHATAHLYSSGEIALLEVEFEVTQASGAVTGLVRDAHGRVTTITLLKDGHATTYSVAAGVEITHDGHEVADTLLSVGDQLEVRVAHGSVISIDIVVDVH